MSHTSKTIAVLAVAVCLAGCGPAVRPVASQPSKTSPTVRLEAVSRALGGLASTTGARQDARSLRVTTTETDPTVDIEAACTGGGILAATLRTPAGDTPFRIGCNSPSYATVVAGQLEAPDDGSYGRNTLTVTGRAGQTWWIDAGATSSNP